MKSVWVVHKTKVGDAKIFCLSIPDFAKYLLALEKEQGDKPAEWVRVYANEDEMLVNVYTDYVIFDYGSLFEKIYAIKPSQNIHTSLQKGGNNMEWRIEFSIKRCTVELVHKMREIGESNEYEVSNHGWDRIVFESNSGKNFIKLVFELGAACEIYGVQYADLLNLD